MLPRSEAVGGDACEYSNGECLELLPEHEELKMQQSVRFECIFCCFFFGCPFCCTFQAAASSTTTTTTTSSSSSSLPFNCLFLFQVAAQHHVEVLLVVHAVVVLVGVCFDAEEILIVNPALDERQLRGLAALIVEGLGQVVLEHLQQARRCRARAREEGEGGCGIPHDVPLDHLVVAPYGVKARRIGWAPPFIPMASCCPCSCSRFEL